MSANKVKFGLEQVHVAFFAEDSTSENPSWDTPIHIKGAVSLTTSPEGEENEFYADNTKYFTYTSNNGYTGELEMANIPDDVLAEMLGMTIDSNGMLVESAEDKPKEFALMGQIQGDQKNRRFVYYRCKASRPGQNSSTSEASVTPNTDTLSLTILPLESNKVIKGVIELNDSNQAVYDAFFDQVTLPNASAE